MYTCNSLVINVRNIVQVFDAAGFMRESLDHRCRIYVLLGPATPGFVGKTACNEGYSNHIASSVCRGFYIHHLILFLMCVWY